VVLVANTSIFFFNAFLTLAQEWRSCTCSSQRFGVLPSACPGFLSPFSHQLPNQHAIFFFRF
jgi:hypothetical protein